MHTHTWGIHHVHKCTDTHPWEHAPPHVHAQVHKHTHSREHTPCTQTYKYTHTHRFRHTHTLLRGKCHTNTHTRILWGTHHTHRYTHAQTVGTFDWTREASSRRVVAPPAAAATPTPHTHHCGKADSRFRRNAPLSSQAPSTLQPAKGTLPSAHGDMSRRAMTGRPTLHSNTRTHTHTAHHPSALWLLGLNLVHWAPLPDPAEVAFEADVWVPKRFGGPGITELSP